MALPVMPLSTKVSDLGPCIAPRITFVLSDGLNSKGGIGRVMSYVSRSLAQRHPEIITIASPSRMTDRGLAKHLTIPFALFRFFRHCRTKQINIAHINIAPRGSTWRKMLFANLARAMGLKLVLHLHGSGYDDYYANLSPALQARITRLFNSADAIVALSPYWRTVLTEQIRIAPGKVHVIGNGVPSPTPAEINNRAKDVSTPPVILFMGEVGSRKGIDILLPALATLSAKGVAFQMVIGGNGGVEEARTMTQNLGIEEHVRFLGWVGEADVARHMAASDIFVLPSRAENQPLSILEAMARGLPVVSTRVGAIPEQVLDGETGYLVPPGETEPLTHALEKLLNDSALRQTMGEAGQRHFSQHHSLEACADHFAQLYHSLLQGTEKP